MINYLNAVIARERERELRSRHRHDRVPGTLAGPRMPADAPQEPDVSIRFARPTDDQALARLAQLDSRPTPSGRVLVAEVAGELLAAVPVDRGEPIGDPFRPTAALTSLLDLRARQLRDSEAGATAAAANRAPRWRARIGRGPRALAESPGDD